MWCCCGIPSDFYCAMQTWRRQAVDTIKIDKAGYFCYYSSCGAFNENSTHTLTGYPGVHGPLSIFLCVLELEELRMFLDEQSSDLVKGSSGYKQILSVHMSGYGSLCLLPYATRSFSSDD
ncbi:hypothetical protein STEG23_005543 [Scotinomys teguina]